LTIHSHKNICDTAIHKAENTLTPNSANTFHDAEVAVLCAPRKLYVASAAEDTWADPVSEYLCCVAASPAWELFGIDGFVHPDNLPEAWDRFADGNIGYHLRPDGHFLSRHDWMRFIDFLKK